MPKPRFPGPPLQKTFTYDGAPNTNGGDKFTTLSREMVQALRFYNSAHTGTHKHDHSYTNIPRNSEAGRGAGGNLIEPSS